MFQSGATPRDGGGRLLGWVCLRRPLVSIRAPVMGATTIPKPLRNNFQVFNPRPRDGGDRGGVSFRDLGLRFNPRPRDGGGPSSRATGRRRIPVSIRAPVMGATSRQHIPAAFDTGFSSRSAPVMGATAGEPGGDSEQRVSIRASPPAVMGATRAGGAAQWHGGVSLRAPVMGANDCSSWRNPSPPWVFQSAPRDGGDRTPGGLCRPRSCFNPRPRGWGRPAKSSGGKKSTPTFQSAPPP